MMLEDNRDKIPPAQYEAVRDQLMQLTLTGMIDQKLLYGEFRRNIPPENMPRIEENLLPHFEEKEVPRLMKQLDVKSQRELEQELSRLGSSLADARQIVQRARDRLGVDSLEDQGQRRSQPRGDGRVLSRPPGRVRISDARPAGKN